MKPLDSIWNVEGQNMPSDDFIKKIDASLRALLSHTSENIVKDTLFHSQFSQRAGSSAEAVSSAGDDAIVPELAVWLFDIVRAENLNKVLAFGSGFSTLAFASAFRENKTGRVLAVEHEEDRYHKTLSLINSSGLSEFAEVVYSPLKEVEIGGVENIWYSLDSQRIAEFLGSDVLDFVFVDKSLSDAQKASRFPAFPWLEPYIAPTTRFLLDDGDRDEEAVIADRWIRLSGNRLRKTTLGHIRTTPVLLSNIEALVTVNKPLGEQGMNAINHDRLTGPMTDYIAELVKRNQIKLEVAEGLALKHQLLMESESHRNSKEGYDLERTASQREVELAQAVERIAALSLTLEDREKRLAAGEHERSDLVSRLAHLQGEVGRQQESLAQAARSHEELERKMSSRDIELATANRELQHNVSRLSELEDGVRFAAENSETLSNEITAKSAKISELRELLQLRDQQLEEVQQVVRQREFEIVDLTAMLDQKSVQIDELLESHRKLNEVVGEKEDHLVIEQSRGQQLTMQLNALQKTIVDLRAQNDLHVSTQRDQLIAQNDRLSELTRDLTAKGVALQDEQSRVSTWMLAAKRAKLQSRELFDLAERLQREQIRSAFKLTQLEARAERVKGHLSYRLGQVLINGSDSLTGLLKIPFKLRQQIKEFKTQRATNTEALDSSGGVSQVLFDGENYGPLLKSWRTLEIGSAGQPVYVRFSILVPEDNAPVFMEICAVKADSDATIVAVGGHSHAISSGEIVSVGFANADSKYTYKVQAGTFVRLMVRRVSGGSAILRTSVANSETPDLPITIDRTISANLSADPLLVATTRSTTEPLPLPVIGHVARLPRFQAPEPIKNSIILQAHELMSKGHIEEALRFARENAKGVAKPAIELLVANRDHADENAWLSSLNRYLGQFSISPITLTAGVEDRFLRLRSAGGAPHTSGPLISVIMPAFNSAKTIGHALSSILNQTWRNLEIFVVDDKSTDETFRVVSEFARRDARVKVLRNERNVGPYVSKNLALQYCTGKFITGHDADDWAHPDRLARQVQELLSSDGALAGNIARMIRMSSDGQFVHFGKQGKTADDGVLREAAISCMFDRDFFGKHLGYWDCVRFGADSELISRAQKVMGERFFRTRLMSMICLDNEGSLTNDPVHGVSKTTGISPTRKFYRDQWTAWHADMHVTQALFPFPYVNRSFLAPDVAVVPVAHVFENIESAKKGILKFD